MAYKLINAAEARPGVAIVVDGVPCITKSNDISKTGNMDMLNAELKQ